MTLLVYDDTGSIELEMPGLITDVEIIPGKTVLSLENAACLISN